MSTTATISITNQNGSVDMVHVHWDGYLTWVGRILAQHYTSRNDAEALIALGDLSTLGENLHDGDGKHPTTAYHRNNGEDLHITHFDNLPQYLNALKHNGEEFNYILGTDKFGDPQWYWVTNSDVKPIFYDENHINVQHYFTVNPESINIADLCKAEDTFNVDRAVQNATRKSITMSKKALIVSFLKNLKKHNQNLFANTSTMLYDESNNAIHVTLRDEETGKTYGSRIYVDALDLNQATARQVLGKLMFDVKDDLMHSKALYTLDEIPIILKLSTIEKDIHNLYHKKNSQGNIAFYYFLHLCHYYDKDSDKDVMEKDVPKLYKYVKKGVDKIYQNLNKYDITEAQIKNVLRNICINRFYDEYSTPYQDYRERLRTGQNPKDPMLVGDPLKQSLLYKSLKLLYQNEVAKDTERILARVSQF